MTDSYGRPYNYVEYGPRKKYEQDQNCSFCVGQRETVEYIIVECGKYEDHREGLIKVISSVIGGGMEQRIGCE